MNKEYIFIVIILTMSMETDKKSIIMMLDLITPDTHQMILEIFHLHSAQRDDRDY